jgi:predicted ATPase
VTVTRPGVVGTTRLSIEVASRLGAELVDGAAVVDLAGVGEPDPVVSTIASALEISSRRPTT